MTSTITFLAFNSSGSQFLAPGKNRQFLRFIHTNNNNPLTITRDFPVHNTFCWVFPIRDASSTCPGVTVLFKKIRGNLRNFAIQLGDQGGRGEECSKVAQSPPSNLCVCVCVLLSMLGGGTATRSILNQECVLMSIFGGGTTISIFNCVCVLVSMLGGGTAIQQQSPS